MLDNCVGMLCLRNDDGTMRAVVLEHVTMVVVSARGGACRRVMWSRAQASRGG